MGKTLKIYDRWHTPLAEIDDYGDDLKYGWTLDDIDTLGVSLALTSPKCTIQNMQFANHLEVVDGQQVVWGGIIFGRCFEDTVLRLNCLDYSAIMKYRRLMAKQFPTMEYGALMIALIQDAVGIYQPVSYDDTDIAVGALQTTRLVKNTDMLWAKVKEFGDDANYDYGVLPGAMQSEADYSLSPSFHFWLRRGSDKTKYTLEWGSTQSNIISKPTLAQDIMSLANSVYAETDGDTPLVSSAEDTDSQNTYGLFDGVFSPNNGVSVQSTLDTQAHGELQRSSQPANSITLTAKDSALCPFSDIEVGDRVTVHLIPYFDFSASMRILRMVHDEKTQTREITAGSIIFKPQPPAKRLYKG